MNRFSVSSAIRRSIGIFAAIVMLCIVGSSQAQAQARGTAQYVPAKPTVSPYVGLLQTNVGPIPNYFSLVRPRLRQQAFEQQVQAVNQVQSLQIQAMADGAGQQAPVTQTGKGAGFMQYLHYYPPPKTVPWRR